VLSATFIVDIVATILLSTILLRLIELVAASQSAQNAGLQFCMEVGTVALLLPSIGLEVISIGFRSFSLGFRIFANVSAGHVLSDIALVSRYLPFQSAISVA
jgi:F0F1-type ATP synthase membrane subunit a